MNCSKQSSQKKANKQRRRAIIIDSVKKNQIEFEMYVSDGLRSSVIMYDVPAACSRHSFLQSECESTNANKRNVQINMPNFIDAGRDQCVISNWKSKACGKWAKAMERARDHLNVEKILKYAPQGFMKISLFKFHKIQYKYNY